jgi:hypothetical protein
MLRTLVRTAPLFLAAVVSAGALAAPSADAGTPAPTTAVDHTAQKVVRPVDGTGHAVTGYTVHRESGSVSCDGQAATGVSRGIDACFPSAYYVPSCWRSRNHTVLCLRDVATKELVRISYSGTYPVQRAVRRPSPQAMTLTNGVTCSIRVGGAWGDAPGHPDWVGFYSCTSGAVYGPGDGDGVDRSQPVWRVHLLRNDGTVVTRRVARATFVGTAS